MIAEMRWEDLSGERPVKYLPGDEIPDDHPKRDWLLRNGIASDGDTAAELAPVESGAEDAVPAEEPQEDAPEDDAEDATAPAGQEKPKPTDSVEKHREYLKAHGVETKGLTRPQLIKAVKDL